METTLESADRSRKRVYSPRNRLRRDMVTGNPIYDPTLRQWFQHWFRQAVPLHDLPARRVHGVTWGGRV